MGVLPKDTNTKTRLGEDKPPVVSPQRTHLTFCSLRMSGALVVSGSTQVETVTVPEHLVGVPPRSMLCSPTLPYTYLVSSKRNHCLCN